MRVIRSVFFTCLAFLFLGALTLTDSAVADDHGFSSSVAAVPVGGSVVDAGVAVQPEQSRLGAFLDAVPQWVQALSLLISAFAAIAALTPTPKDDGVLAVLRKIVDLLALNFGGARNERRDKASGDYR